jgi:acetyl esterase/lipase
MPVDPDLQRALDQLGEAGFAGLGGATPEAARAAFDAVTRSRRGPDYEPEAVDRVTDDEAPGPEGPIPVRVYEPGDEPAAVIAYFHGGGFVIGSIETHDPVCRWMANALGAVVVSVGYRLAPEHPFPAALDDCAAALRWVAGLRPGLPLAVAGDSAGATLAIGTALRARDEGGPELAAALLFYPSADPTSSHPSVEENGEGHFLTKQDVAWFQQQYTPREEDRADPHVDLLHADLHGLPPTIVATAQYDPLRDEGIALAEQLDRAGVEVQHVPGPGMIHGYVGFAAVSPGASAHRAAVLQRFAALLEPLSDRAS